MNVAKPRRHRLWVTLIAWANFVLLMLAMMKFIPLLISLSYGIDLAPEHIARGLGHERAWALDLISDTPYLLTVWLLVAGLLRWQAGQARWVPWQ
jgi:hypothetical protein